MVSLLSRGVGVVVKSLAGLSFTQAARCSSLPSALSAIRCSTARWFSENITSYDFPKAPSPGDPPKRPLPAYFRFFKQHRPLIAKQHPGASFKDISTFTADKWRALSDPEKQVYLDAARLDLMQYRDTVQKYKDSLNPLDLEMLKEKKKQKMEKLKKIQQKRDLKLLGRPKQPRSAYNIFMSEHYHEAKGNYAHEKLKAVANDWQNMHNSKKQVYMQLAQDDKVRYLNEVKAWEEQMMEIGREDLVRYGSRLRVFR
ncbi:PREDICTED: transcription factor A, mitochondrial [Nanorana parkeri]|uniref:transcription factor A, mitochondrial n=1 Tax=Nanorana parkeri TaxID=125878 RepID=UPI00085465D5|nr:PREDICTED: transcription factor A, mitochondrial [Nanorana parkeri]